jgi:exopolysaccharide biosynthesis polyprenyl glycosylphosphotransferase
MSATAEHAPSVSPVPQQAAPALAASDPGSLRPWQRRYMRRLVVGDLIAVSAACAGGALWRDQQSAAQPHPLGYAALALAMTTTWLLVLGGQRAYEPRFLGCGSEEYKRVTHASVQLALALAAIAFVSRLPVARSFVALTLSIGTGALLTHRFFARRVLYRARVDGSDLHRVLVLGDRVTAESVVAAVARDVKAGFHVVGACLSDLEASSSPVRGVVPVLGGPEDVVSLARCVGADTIAVTASVGNTPERLRRLAWDLEGTGIDLIVAPALTDIAGPRVSIRPVAGLPLLHVEQPDITGARYLLKEIAERAVALVIILLALPLMVVVAAAIKLTSPGPVLFSQTRVSRHGREFSIYKFRSMRVDAEALLQSLQQCNETDGLMFKMKQDPRVTSVGRWLRRWSLDELPQLLNVVRGDMALIGPRPPLPCEVAAYTDGVHRRLLVKPGMTGLWQVSGRSDLSWDESVRLDLYYVENWSLALDVQILARTVRAIVRGTGAY